MSHEPHAEELVEIREAELDGGSSHDEVHGDDRTTLVNPTSLEIQEAQTAWWDANKRWFLWVLIGVPVGASVLGLVLALIGVTVWLWSTPVAGLSLDEVRASAEVVDVLGEPIEAGWFIQGSVDESAGVAELRYVVNGSKAEGGVRVKAELIDGDWVVTGLDIGVGEEVVVVKELPEEE